MAAKLLIPFLVMQRPLWQNLAWIILNLSESSSGTGMKLDKGMEKKAKSLRPPMANKVCTLADTEWDLKNFKEAPGIMALASSKSSPDPTRTIPVTFPGLKIPV